MTTTRNSLGSSPILQHLQDLHDELSTMTEGEVATYIPELAKANPNLFGICVVTVNGAVYEVGDCQEEFTIQSISKPFVYGLALEDRGRADVLKKVGIEPTGDAFNSISLDPVSGRPRNSMINAGAIAVSGLIEGKTAKTRLARILEMFEHHSGRELLVDDAVYRSESESGHRNRAIGHMLRNFGILTEDPGPVVEVYFHQCSISVTCRDLAVMAATLANRGVNPITGKQALRGEYVENVLAVMGTCGMYDYAGEWLYNVGMPAKSGVSGGVLAVLPGQLGIGIFSPRLDSHGNSVRGIRVCEALSQRWDLHLFNRPPFSRSAIRVKSTAVEFNSNRVRSAAELALLQQCGSGIKIYQLQGNLVFAAAEVVVRDVIEGDAEIDSVILDFKRVLTVSESACRIFHDLLSQFIAADRPLLFVHTDGLPNVKRYMKAKLGERFDESFHTFADLDSALEWCENRIIARLLPEAPGEKVAGLGEYAMLSGLDAQELQTIAALLERRTFQPGATIIQAGDEARELFLLASGRVSVLATLASGRRKRLASFSPGMAFGEMAIIDHAPRSATIVADTEVACDLLSLADFEGLRTGHPRIMIRLLENLSLGLCGKLRKANREITVFE